MVSTDIRVACLRTYTFGTVCLDYRAGYPLDHVTVASGTLRTAVLVVVTKLPHHNSVGMTTDGGGVDYRTHATQPDTTRAHPPHIPVFSCPVVAVVGGGQTVVHRWCHLRHACPAEDLLNHHPRGSTRTYFEPRYNAVR